MAANMAGLADRLGINSMVEMMNRQVVDKDAFRKEWYYDNMMLDKIKISESEYVFLQYAKSYTMPKGHEKWLIRRNYPLTEHPIPLLEGIPPRSDKTRKEKIYGTYHQYGRYMEFSDRVEWQLLDPIMMEYSYEYGDVAVRTMHRLARQELLNSTFTVYANNRANVGELQVGDTVGLSTFRVIALKLNRLLVKKINGVYPVITSPEHIQDLMKDELILEFLGSLQGLPHYKSGELPVLFDIKFVTTQFDDFNYGYELGNPGEWADAGGDIFCRVYAPHPGWTGAESGDGSHPYIYANVAATGSRVVYAAAEYRAEETMGDGTTKVRSEHEGLGNLNTGASAASEATNRLSDGSWIPVRTIWTFSAAAILGATAITSALSSNQAEWEQLGTSAVYYKYVDATGIFTLGYKQGDTYSELGTITTEGDNKGKLTQAQMNTLLPAFSQLPVHKAILLGDEALAKLAIDGEGNVKMYAKPKGSAGVLDPIDQRQSIGFKINTLGFKRIREEACWVIYHVPTQAPTTAGISIGVDPRLSNSRISL